MIDEERPDFTPPRGLWNGNTGVSPRAKWLPSARLTGDFWAAGPGSILLGRSAADAQIALTDDRHLVTIAGSRAGKTLTMLVPNLRHYRGSALVIDPKGELAEMTAAHRAAMGQEVHLLDPFGVIAERGELRRIIEANPGLHLTDKSARYNPIDELAGFKLDSQSGEAAGMADALIQSSERDPHWGDAARKLVQAVALTLVRGIGNQPANLNTIVRFFGSTEVQRQVYAAMQSVDDFDGFLNDVATTNLERIERSSGEYSSIVSTGDTQLGPLRDMAKISADSDFALADLKRRPMTIYLVLPASKLGSHARWLRMIIGLAIAALERPDLPKPPHPVLFVLEEFASLGNMRAIERAAGYMAGFDLRLWSILQDIGQLRAHYRESWGTFLGNAGMVQVFGLNDGETEEYVSRRLGMTQFDELDTLRPSSGFDQKRVSVPQVKRFAKLLEPHEVRLLFARRTGMQLIMIPDYDPIGLRRLPYAGKGLGP